MKEFSGLLGWFFLLMISACATIEAPNGGLKDQTPPKLTKTIPEQNSIRFSDNELSFYFDEFVEWYQPNKTVFISPYTPQVLRYDIIGKRARIKFPEGLKNNTTYSIQLFQAFRDFNEGNVSPNFNLNFSTGYSIDSGKLTVIAQELGTKKNNDKALACLVRTRSDFFGKNYAYLSPVISGSASFSNLDKQSYFLYVFADSNSNMKWEKNEPIAFYPNPIKAENQRIGLKLYKEENAKTNFTISKASFREFDIQTNQALFNPKILDENSVLISLGALHHKLICKNNSKPSSLRIQYHLDKYETFELPSNDGIKPIAMISLGSNRMGMTYRPDSVSIPFNSFISQIDTSKIKLYIEDKRVPVRVSFSKNSLNLFSLDKGKNYRLSLDSHAIKFYSQYNLPQIISFSTFGAEMYYESIEIKPDIQIVSNPKIIVFLESGSQYIRLPSNGLIYLKNLYAQELKFRILKDENGDGIWTSGNVERNITPEFFHDEVIRLESKKNVYPLTLNLE